MNANEFTIRLKEIAPSKVLLLDCDYGADEADRFIKSFECRRRSQPIGIESNGDSMLELLDKWDISHVEIGPICFHAEPEKFDGHLEIGTIEGDRLVYRPDAKDYVLLDSQNLEHVMVCVSNRRKIVVLSSGTQSRSCMVDSGRSSTLKPRCQCTTVTHIARRHMAANPSMHTPYTRFMGKSMMVIL